MYLVYTYIQVKLVSRLKQVYPANEVAILTPYLGQKDCLMRTFCLKPECVIKTINESQGKFIFI